MGRKKFYRKKASKKLNFPLKICEQCSFINNFRFINWPVLKTVHFGSIWTMRVMKRIFRLWYVEVGMIWCSSTQRSTFTTIIDFVYDENPTGVQWICVCVCCSKSSEVVLFNRIWVMDKIRSIFKALLYGIQSCISKRNGAWKKNR